MQLGRDETITGLQAEYRAFSELLRSLDGDAWRAPTRCEGWEVRDIGGHVVGVVTDIAAGKPGSRTPDEEAVDAHGKSPVELADALDEALAAVQPVIAAITADAWEGPSPVDGMNMRQAVTTLWYDTFVHADDIRSALGRPSKATDGLRAAVAYLAEQLTDRGWGPATLELDGFEPIRIGVGDGPTVAGDPLPFVLVATGRLAPGELGLDDKVNIYA